MRKDWFEDDNEIRLLHRGKRRLLDIVFGRTMVITLLLVLQIAIMVLGAHYLGRYYPALSGIMHVLAVVLIIYLVNKPGSATTKITWIVLIMALPAFGVLLYLFVQLDIGHRYANRRVQESILSTVQYVPRQTELMARLRTCAAILKLLGGEFVTHRDGEAFTAEFTLPVTPPDAAQSET